MDHFLIIWTSFRTVILHFLFVFEGCLERCSLKRVIIFFFREAIISNFIIITRRWLLKIHFIWPLIIRPWWDTLLFFFIVFIIKFLITFCFFWFLLPRLHFHPHFSQDFIIIWIIEVERWLLIRSISATSYFTLGILILYSVCTLWIPTVHCVCYMLSTITIN